MESALAEEISRVSDTIKTTGLGAGITQKGGRGKREGTAVIAEW